MIQEVISRLVERQSLTADEASRVMAEIMEGKITGAQFGCLVTALRLKGETEDEIIGFARTMRQKAICLATKEPVIDTCGMGGDSAGTFNISTAAAFVAAASGLKVAKHGGRAVSSQCGSADVLEEIGIKIELSPQAVSTCLEEIGIGFMFAPLFHPAMKFAAGPRRELGIRTVFNLLGPLANPACAASQVVGVADEILAQKIASVLRALGSQRALVVYGQDGLDELTVCEDNLIIEVKNGELNRFQLKPEEAGLKRHPRGSLGGGTTAQNAVHLLNVLSGQEGPRLDAVLLNSAAAMLAGGKTSTFYEGVELSRYLIQDGKALQKLEGLIKLSRELA